MKHINLTRADLVGMIAKQTTANRHTINISHTPYQILSAMTIDNVAAMIEDNSLPLFIVSSKRDVEFKDEDIEILENIEQLVWDEMLENMEIVKSELIGLGLVAIPLLGQYKYEKTGKITFEHSILVPMSSSFTGYSLSDENSLYHTQVSDFQLLAQDLCGVLGQETILFKSPHVTKEAGVAADAILLHSDGSYGDWIGRKVKRFAGGEFIELASMLFEDAEAEVPDLGIQELYKEDLRDTLRKSDKWWSISSSRGSGLVSMLSSLYSLEDKKKLNALSIRNSVAWYNRYS